MNETCKYGILWKKWLGGFAAFVWIVGTYVGLLIGAVLAATFWARAEGGGRAAAAFMGVLLASAMHWLLFTAVQYGQLKRLNEKQ